MGVVEPILDHVDGIVLYLDVGTFRPFHANRNLCHVVGESVEAWTQRPAPWQGLFDPEDWPRVERLCHAVARDGRKRRITHLLRCAAGRARSYRTSLSLLRNVEGRDCLLAHMLDLSDEGTDDLNATEETWLREILRQAPLAVFAIDDKGVVQLAEGMGLATLGISPAEMLGHSMVRGRWPGHWMTENASRALKGEAFSELVATDGTWLSVKYAPVRDRTGAVRGALGFATDVTECKRVVDLIGTIDAVLWQVQGAERHLAFLGGAADKLLGEDPEPWLGRADFFERHLLEEERADVLGAIERVAKDGVERTIAHRIRRADGQERWCRTTLRAVPGVATGSCDVVGLMLDVTERKVIERALIPNDRRWQIVAEQAPVVVYTLDRELRFTSGIGAGLAALGLKPTGTLIGVPIEQYFHAPSARPLIDAHRNALAGATVRTRRSWRRRTYDVRLEPLREEGGAVIGVVGVAVDVTEQHRRERYRERLLEAERAAHAQADEAVQMRDQLFGIASHELRTPLSGLLLTLQAARAGAPDDLAMRKLQLAERQALRLNAMIEELLDASRLSAGRSLDLEPEDVDLCALTQQVVTRFEPELDASKTSVAVRIPGPVMGHWDRSRLDQVITNLLSNAIKYGRGQPVEIAVESVRPDLARLSVRDHGIGIASQDLRLLFHPFQRLHANHHYRGFGLGLFIVSEIVRAHGGQVNVESEPEKGARFTVDLPTEIRRVASIE